MGDLHEHNSKQNIRVCLLELRFSLSSGLDKGDPYMKSVGVPVRNFEKNPQEVSRPCVVGVAWNCLP